MSKPRLILLVLSGAACVHLAAGATGCCSALYLPAAEVTVRGVVVDATGTPAAGVRIAVTGLYSGQLIVSTVPFEGIPADYLPQTDQDGAFEAAIPLPTGTCPPRLKAPLGPYGYSQLDELEIRILADDCTRTVVVQFAGGTMVSADGNVIELQDSVEMSPCATLWNNIGVLAASGPPRGLIGLSAGLLLPSDLHIHEDNV
jgi:hypothetical protein